MADTLGVRGDHHSASHDDLYLSNMDRMGVKLDQFGDAETRLARL